jgi:alkylhydroperoxidase family enzyme
MSSTPRTSVELGDVAPALEKARAAFQQVAYPGKIDLVTRELVRIRSGQLSHCVTCRNTRLQASYDRGLSEDMVSAVDDPATGVLTDRQKAALRFTEAFLVDPATADLTELRTHFTPEQVAELVLDLIRLRPGSKLAMASGRDLAEDGLVVI